MKGCCLPECFTGMNPLESIHFHDVEKNVDIVKDLERYHQHLNRIFIGKSEENNRKQIGLPEETAQYCS